MFHLLKLTIMTKKENVKKLSLWQKIRLMYNLKFKKRIPEELRFGAIDIMSVNQVRAFRHNILGFSDEELHPLFAERNCKKLKKICGSSLLERIFKHDDADEIRAYLSIDFFEIPEDWAEKYFVNRSIDEFFKPYLDSHDNWLPGAVVNLLIERGQEMLLLYYINQFKEDECHNIDQKLLFKSSMETAKYAFAEKFLDDDGCEETICYILENGDEELVKKLLQKTKIPSDKAWELLFARENPDFIDLVIEKLDHSSGALPDIFWDELLKKGSIEQIKKCIDRHPLDTQDELRLVCSENNEAILHYLKTVQRPFEELYSENYMFSHADKTVLDYYRNNICLPYTEERALIKEGNVEKICTYLKSKREINDMNAVLLVETSFSTEVLKTFIEECKISDIIEVALLKRNLKAMSSFYITRLINDKKHLSAAAEAMLIKTGDFSLIKQYLSSISYELSDEAKKAILYRGDASLLAEFVKADGYIDEDVIVEFVNNTSYEILSSYFAANISLPEQGEVALVKRNQPNLINAYISAFENFSAEGEVALVQLKNIKLLKYYIQTAHELYEMAEKELLLLGDEELFLSYIEQTPLFNDNEVELVKLGHHAWLDAYIEKYNLCDEAALEFAKVY